jgi:hypothetical protein
MSWTAEIAHTVEEKIERYDDRLHEIGRDAAVVKFVVQEMRRIDVEDEPHQERDRRVRHDRMERQRARRRIVRVERGPHHLEQIEPYGKRRDVRENFEPVGCLARQRFLRELDVRFETKAGP